MDSSPIGVGKWSECFPLTSLTSRLPSLFQCGLHSSALILTSISSFTDHLIIGTNVGLVYLCHLPSLHIIRLKCENALNRITCITGLRSIDDLIAAGSVDGCITVFLLPRVIGTVQLPSPRAGVGCDLKRFSVTSLHKCAITSLAWSCNGLRVVTGDAEGCIGLLEVDYDEGTCVARHVLREEFPVVQLSYWKQTIAISTEERCIAFNIPTSETRPVGTKPRKSLGKYGVCWNTLTEQSSSSDLPVLYTSRPGQRIWLAHSSGTVHNTMQIRDIPYQSRIYLPDQRNNETLSQETIPSNLRFEAINLLDTGQLVLSSSDSLVIFNPTSLTVEGFLYKEDFFRSVALCHKFIYILGKNSQLFCVYHSNSSDDQVPPFVIHPSPLSSQSSGLFSDSPTSIREIGNKLYRQSSSIFGNIAKIGGTIASKVTESATGINIVTGFTEDLEPNYNRNLTVNHNSITKQSVLGDSLQFIGATHQNPTHVQSTDIQSKLYDGCSEVSEDQTVSSNSHSPLSDEPPLVVRAKIKTKHHRSKPATNSDSNNSPETTSSSSPTAASDSNITTPSEDSHHIMSQESITEHERKLEELLGIKLLVERNVGESKQTNVSNNDQSECNNDENNSKYVLGSSTSSSVVTNTNPVEAYSDNKYDRMKSEQDGGSIDRKIPSTEEALMAYQTQSEANTSVDTGDETFKCEDYLNNLQEVTSTSLNSNVSDCSYFSNIYGPPSGSSVPSLHSLSSAVMPGSDYNNAIKEESTDEMHHDLPAPSCSKLEFTQHSVAECKCICSDGEVRRGDWRILNLPSALKCASSSDKYFVFTNSENYIFIGEIKESKVNIQVVWHSCMEVPMSVSSLSLSPSGCTLWVLCNDSVYECRLESHKHVDDAEKDTNNIVYVLRPRPLTYGALHVCGGDGVFFCLKDDYKVYCQYQEKDGRYREVGLDSNGYSIVHLSYRDLLLWAVDDMGRVLFRIGQTKCNPAGHAWGIMNEDEKVVSCSVENTLLPSNMSLTDQGGDSVKDGTRVVCLGPQGVGWRLTNVGCVQFRPGVSHSIQQGANTRWWQVVQNYSSSDVESTNTLLCSTATHLVKATIGDSFVTMHPVSTSGTVWEIVGTDCWSQISAESLYEGHGSLACLSPTRQLMMVNPNTGVALPIPMPDGSPVACVSQRPEALWLLTATGDVWIRGGLTWSAHLGIHWHKLDIDQLSAVQLCYLSLGPEAVWAVDTGGGVHFRQGSLAPPHPAASPQAWLPLEKANLLDNSSLVKVFAGPKRSCVWALDDQQRVYARIAIYPDLTVGAAWEPVPGIKAIHLSICEKGTVYAITVTGEMFRREGVDPPNNFIGNLWVQLPHTMAFISASVDEQLWGLSCSADLCKSISSHSILWQQASHETEKNESRYRHDSLSGEGWEVV